MSEKHIPKNEIINKDATIKEALSKFQEFDAESLSVSDDTNNIIGEMTLNVILSLLASSDSLEQTIAEYIEILGNSELNKSVDIMNSGVETATLKEKLGKIESEDSKINVHDKCEIISMLSKNYFNMYSKMQFIVESVPSGIIAINNDQNIIVVNEKAENMLQVKRENVLGKKIDDICNQAIFMYTKDGIGKIENRKIHTGLYDVVLNSAPIYKDGQIIGGVAVFQDVSELEKVTLELRETQDRLKEIQSIIESSYDGILIADNTGKVEMVNSAWERLCGIKREDIVGKVTAEMVERGFYNKSVVQNTLMTKKITTIMLEMTSGDKKGQKILATGNPEVNENGELVRVIANIRNITELENLKSQLEESKQLTQKYSSEIEEMRKQQQKFPDIVAESPEMRGTMEIVVRAADVDATVLITGESGVGKEIVSKYLHKLSKRSEGPFIKINCAAIPANLLESELFGYMPGAFTGASKQGKIGLFELANDGTLLLDEIGELPVELQVKLLRVIQGKELTRIGGDKPIKVNSRLIAATNRDLKKMMEVGEFREDLYYRLNIINIHIAPLRGRLEDIPSLIMFFLDKYAEKHNRKKTITMPAVEILREYPWPGNIRELENLVERLIVLTEDEEIKEEHIPDIYKVDKVQDSTVQINGIMPLKEAVTEVERQLLQRAKDKYGSTRKMAKALGVDQSTIVRKTSSLNIIENKIDN